jgi:hypothetical protein
VAVRCHQVLDFDLRMVYSSTGNAHKVPADLQACIDTLDPKVKIRSPSSPNQVALQSARALRRIVHLGHTGELLSASSTESATSTTTSSSSFPVSSATSSACS